MRVKGHTRRVKGKVIRVKGHTRKVKARRTARRTPRRRRG